MLLDVYKLVNQNVEKLISVHWGRLASHILLSNWEDCTSVMEDIKSYIDNPKGDLSYKKQLHQRSWLLTWSLFFSFRTEQGIQEFLDLTQEERYRQTLQNGCPWVIRYIILAVLALKHKHVESLKDIQRLVFIESYQYQDPTTEFVTALLKNFQFNKAEIILEDISSILSTDYFIPDEIKGMVLKNSREMIWKYFLSVHSVCKLGFLAEKLHVDIGEAENWTREILSEFKKEFEIDNGIILLKSQSETDQLLSQFSQKFSSQ